MPERAQGTGRWAGEFEQQELDCFAHHHKPFELCQATLQRWLASRLRVLDALSPDERRLLIATIWQYAPGTLWRRWG